uniref:(northern house mosquito) hypothetical protein n=1 Tax=Culex pipiens TaxID=7175 RepID=A0A8D8F0B1_CULPI
MLVLDSLMLWRIPAIVLPVAIAHRHTGRRRGRHRRALPLSAGQRSGATAATTTSRAANLTSTANHAGVMLLGVLLRRLLLQAVLILRMMMRTAAGSQRLIRGSHRPQR